MWGWGGGGGRVQPLTYLLFVYSMGYIYRTHSRHEVLQKNKGEKQNNHGLLHVVVGGLLGVSASLPYRPHRLQGTLYSSLLFLLLCVHESKALEIQSDIDSDMSVWNSTTTRVRHMSPASVQCRRVHV